MKIRKSYIRFINFALIVLTLFSLSGCEESGGERKRATTEKYDFVIVTKSGGIEEQTSQYIAADLTELGYSSVVAFEGERREGDYSCVVFVGTEDEGYEGIPSVVCDLDGNEKTEENAISPSLFSSSLARAAVLLLPEAKSFSLISAKKGAADVQDACDLLDMSGVDYTVEALDGRSYGDAVFDAAEKGCDVLILPSGDCSGGGVQLSEYKTAVIAVGGGEPVRGCLASFCIDTESLAEATARLGVSVLTGEDADIKPESYYSLCISESMAEEFCIDIEAVSEDFRVVMVE